MSRALVLAIALGWAGATLLFGRLRWFRRPPLATRIRPYLTGAGTPIERPRPITSPASRPILAGSMSTAPAKRTHDFVSSRRAISAPIGPSPYWTTEMG